LIFAANLAACLVFALAIFGIGSLASGSLPPLTLEDMTIVAAYTSPAWLWAGGAWAARGRRRLPIAWLSASVVLMTIGVLAFFLDAWNIRLEPPGEETQQLGGFVAIFLQWAVGIVLLWAFGLVNELTQLNGHQVQGQE
jgi:hypothetical protein